MYFSKRSVRHFRISETTKTNYCSSFLYFLDHVVVCNEWNPSSGKFTKLFAVKQLIKIMQKLIIPITVHILNDRLFWWLLFYFYCVKNYDEAWHLEDWQECAATCRFDHSKSFSLSHSVLLSNVQTVNLLACRVSLLKWEKMFPLMTNGFSNYWWLKRAQVVVLLKSVE